MQNDTVKIFDTTLRDGEQSPGATMTLDEKLTIARKLEELGVDVIEAGFPAASPGELKAVRRIAESIVHAEVAGLCRTREGDIEASWKALQTAKHPRLHVFIATSDLHLEHKLKMTRPQVLEEIRRAVSSCRSRCASVEFSAEDATRSDIVFLKEAIACAVENGATTVNIPDTVGYTMPNEYAAIIKEMVKIADPRGAVVSTHCHNDLGLAVANSIAAIEAGARQIECTINGIGERAGNAAMEELVMALRVRADLLKLRTNIRPEHFVSASRLVSDSTGMMVQPNKAIVGKNAFAHESGIHQHGVLKERRTYEIMRPEDVGVTETSLVLGKHSGRHALSDRLKQLGYQLGNEALDKVFARFKELSDKKKNIYDEDLRALVGDDVLDAHHRFELVSIDFSGGTEQQPRATVKLRAEGQLREANATGDGPVNAAIEALKLGSGYQDITLDTYALAAITDGSDAQGRVSLSIRDGRNVHRGQAAHTDIVVASALAFLNALNHLASAKAASAAGSIPPATATG